MYWNLLLMNPISITYITNYKIFQDIQYTIVVISIPKFKNTNCWYSPRAADIAR